MNNKYIALSMIALMQLVIKPAFGMQLDSSPGLQKPLGGEQASRETSPETVQANGQASRGLTDSPQTVQASRSDGGAVLQRKLSLREQLENQKEERKKALLEQKKANPQAPGVNGLIVGSPKSYPDTDQKLPFQLEDPPVVKKDDPKNAALEIWAKIRNKNSVAVINKHYDTRLLDHQLKAAITLGNFKIIPHEQRSYLLIPISAYQLLFSDDGKWVQYTDENAPLFVIPFIKKEKQKYVCKDEQEEAVEECEVTENDFKWRGQEVFRQLDNNPAKTRLLLSAVNKGFAKKLYLNDLKKRVIFHYPASACVGIKISRDQEIFLNYSGDVILMAQNALKTNNKVQIFPFIQDQDEDDELQFAMDGFTIDE